MCIISPMKYYGYDEFKKDTNTLVSQMKEFDPQCVVGIARGGLILSHCIAEGLGIRDVQSLRTELYDDMQKRDKISVFNTTKFKKNVKRVMVVDDIADSGDTLKAVLDELKSKNKDIEFKAATLFYKRTSVHKPEYWINEAHEWIEFFWEKDFIS